MAFDAFFVFKKPAKASFMEPPKEFTDTRYKLQPDEFAIEVSSFYFGVDNIRTIGSASGGAGAGKAQFKALTLKKQVDGMSHYFFGMNTTGVHFDDVRLLIYKSGGDVGKAPAEPYIRYTFKMVFVTGVDYAGSTGDDVPEETVELQFGAMQIEYLPLLKTGGTAPPDRIVSAKWSVVLNKADLAVM